MNLFNDTKNRNQRGNILLVAMGTILVLGIALASILNLTIQEHRILARTSAWNAALPVAEAGIEEALSHLCQVNLGNRATNGWQGTSSNFVLVRTNLANSRFVVAIGSGTDPAILSSGFAWCESAGRFIERHVLVTTKWSPVMPGLVAKTKAEVQGTTRADSYDSESTLYSTGGRYDPLKFNDESMVGCIDGNVMVKDSARVYGGVGTDTGSISVVNPARVGSTAWVTSNNGLQVGASTTDLAMSFPSVVAPVVTNWITSIPASRVLSNANYRIANYTLGGTLRVKGQVVLYCTSEFHPSGGQVIIETGGKLSLYFGSQFYAEGTLKINTNGTPDQFAVYGVGSNAKEVYIQGDSSVVGTIYAPVAKMYVQDNSHFSGAGACNELVLQGQAQFHYDESLGRAGQPFRITSWDEL